MAKRSWTLALADGEHTVEMEHNYWSGRRTVRVDGVVAHQARPRFIDFGSADPFTAAGRPALSVIATNGLSFKLDVVVDGRSLTTGLPYDPPLPFPAWGWVFAILCLLIPFVAAGGVVPMLLGFVAAGLVRNVAVDPRRAQTVRAFICLGIAVGAWLIYAFFLFLIVRGI